VPNTQSARSEAERTPRSLRTPDQRLRVFVSSTLEELAPEREAAREAIEGLRLTPVMFELGARTHPPANVYRAYLEQSDVFVGIYGERYGWVSPGMDISGLEDEYRQSAGKPRLVYVKTPAPGRDSRLAKMIEDVQNEGAISYKTFETPQALRELLQDDLAVLLTERFASAANGATRVRAAIPAAVDEFVGRDGELRRFAELVDGGVRLITVAGPGGVGKTRFALEAARRALHRFRDGAAFVALDAVTEADLVVPSVLAALSLPADPAAKPLDALADHLHDRSLLLVLDNFEQVLAAAPAIAELVARCPELSIVVTSRSVLRLRGERELVLEPLDDADAFELFTERARQLEPGFDASGSTGEDVAELCRRLEGVPLALELAAARIRTLTPATMIDRLGAGLDLLAGGRRDAPARQRSLRAAIDWSFELLPEQEQAVLTRASVFRGGWELEAAEAIAAPDAADRLQSLLEHSLIKRVVRRDTARFVMLESVRAFAGERLEQAGHAREVRANHARFYLELVERLTPSLHGAGQVAALERLDLENENLRAAISWSLEHGDADAVAAVAPGLMHFWWLRGHLDEGLHRVGELLAAPTLSEVSRGRALLVQGFLTFWRAPDAGSAQAFADAAAAFDALGDAANAALARVPLAVMRASGGDPAALADLDEGERILGQSGDEWGALLALNGLCYALNATEAEATLDLFEDAVARARASGLEAELATALGNLGRRHVLRGELDLAQLRLTHALRIVRRLRSKTGSAYYVSAVADLAARRGELGLAVRLFAAAGASGVAAARMFERERERAVAAARRQASETTVEELERAGAELDIGAAVDEALAWDEHTAIIGAEPAGSSMRAD
jgi:predicted ATPase